MPGLADLLTYGVGGHRGTLAELGKQQLPLQSKRLSRNPMGAGVLTSMFQGSPAIQDWAHPEALAETQGVEAVRGGQESVQRRSQELAGLLGLGRSFASQTEIDTEQQAVNEISGALLASQLLGQERRAMLEQMMLDAIMGGAQQRTLLSAQHRARQASPMENFSLLGAGVGDLLGGVGSVISAFNGGGG